jgi:putative acetyltransferase
VTPALRPAGEADWPAVRAMQDASFLALALSYPGAMRRAHSRLIWGEGWLEDLRRSDIWVAEGAGGAILGSAGWIATGEPGVARVRKVFVHPTAARQGLGTALTRAAEARSGAARIVLRANLDGVPLYRRLGYAAEREGTMELPEGPPMPVLFMARG